MFLAMKFKVGWILSKIGWILLTDQTSVSYFSYMHYMALA